MSKTTARKYTKTAAEYLKEPYARILIPEAEGGYSAEILEFSGCYSFGDTADETMRNLEDAALNWIEAAMGQGQTIPEPFAKNEFSGKALLRLPRGLHQKAAQMAEREHVSLNTYLVQAIAEKVGATQVGTELRDQIRRLLKQYETQSRIALTYLLNPTYERIEETRTTVEKKVTESSGQLPPGYFVSGPKRSN